MSAEGVEAKLARLDQRMSTVEEGVSNFRNFQTDMRDFVSRYDERQREEERRSKSSDRRLNAILVLLTLIGAAFTVALFLRH